ncbi:metal-dependent hydrolase [Gangjinia marincola]|uniref:Metal-dependent hydrolase n=1 Tax=Gangjinia marincola TaxID=578463 RepID=A0ABN1MIZ0_9FLAO
MDSLTQIVLGAAVGEAVLGHKIGNKALLYGAIAGTIPDLDVAANYFTDKITATEIHRGFSHSIFFSILMAPALGWLTSKLERKQHLLWKPWAWLFFWGLFTHPLLDAFTTWGTQLFWPLDTRIAINSIFVIDPLYTLPFLCCVMVVLFKKKGSLSRKKTNWLGIYLSTGYLLLTVILKYITYQKFEAALQEQQIAYTRILTRPSAFNTILWNANVETEDAYLLGEYSFFDTRPITFTRFKKQRNASEEIRQEKNVQRLIYIAQGWYLMEQIEGVWFFYDLRFGLMPINETEEVFVFAYELTQRDGEFTAKENRKTPESAQFLLNKLWGRLKGN